MKNILTILIIALNVFLGWSQKTPVLVDSSGYKLLQNVGTYALDTLKWKIHSDFYKRWASNENPNIYIYVSRKDSLKSGINGNFLSLPYDEEKILAKKSEYEKMDFDVMVYKTYGTSNVMLSSHLLSYSFESLLFISFHEATHLQISRNVSLPYIYVEAICDLMGTQASLAFTKYNPNQFNKVAILNEKIETISAQINACILAAENIQNNQEDCKNTLQQLVNSIDENELFLNERYRYEINNAYLIRNRSYTKYYYKLKNLFSLQNNDFQVFWDFIKKLPNNENLINDLIEKEILFLKDSKNK